MWVDIDDFRADLERLCRKAEEMLAGEKDETLRATHIGRLIGYTKVKSMLDELEENYRKQGLEYIRSLREEQK